MPLELLKIKADKSQFCATSCTHTAFFHLRGFHSAICWACTTLMQPWVEFPFPFPFPSLSFPFSPLALQLCGHAAVSPCPWGCRTGQKGAELPQVWNSSTFFIFSLAILGNCYKQIDCCCSYNVILHIRLQALNLLDNVYLAGKQFVSLFYCQQDIEL